MNAPVRNLSNNAYAARLASQGRTPPEFQVEPRVYYHHHNYAKFHFDMGGSSVKSVSFANHRYVTDDKREQDQLDLVADLSGSYIYTIPDSDVARELQLEQARLTQEGVLQAAQAQAADRGQSFDPNVPIVPIVSNVPQSALQMTPVPQQAPTPQGAVAVVGMANSLSGTAATETGQLQNTVPNPAPPSSADAAAARLAAMTAEVAKK